MAIAFDTPSGGTSGSVSAGSTSLTYAFNNVAGDYMTVGVFNVASDGTPTATYNGVSMSQIATHNFTATRKLTVFGLSSPATGSHNVVITQTGTSFLYSTAMSHSGTNSTGQPDSFNTGTTASGTTLAVSTTVVASNCWLLGYCAGDNGNNPGAGSGTTLRAVRGADAYVGGLDSNGTVGTGSQTLNFTMPVTQAIGAIVFSIKPVASASGPANLKSYNTNLKANIKSIDTNLIANVKSLDTNV